MALHPNATYEVPAKYKLDVELMDAVATTHLKPVQLATENEYMLMHLGYHAGFSNPVRDERYHNNDGSDSIKSPVNKVKILSM